MHESFEGGAEFRWLNKPVLDSRLLDGKEDTTNWTFAGVGEMRLADGRATAKVISPFS
jgi:hypothetical protein